MDQESWIKEITDILPVDVNKESFIEEIKRRSKLLRAHEILSEELLSLYKAEGYAGLETLRHIMDTKLMLADYRERLERDGKNPFEDKNYQSAHKMVLESVKVLQDIQHKDAQLELKKRELDEHGAWSVKVKDGGVVRVDEEEDNDARP